MIDINTKKKKYPRGEKNNDKLKILLKEKKKKKTRAALRESPMQLLNPSAYTTPRLEMFSFGSWNHNYLSA